ncbi:ankyrin, partial [Zopfia rhizophila CBS 207.26]
KLLLDKGADVNAQGGSYGNALHAASERDHEQIVKLLLDKGADVNAQGGTYGNALHAALERGHEQIVKLLLDKGAAVNVQSAFLKTGPGEKKTHIWYCCECGYSQNSYKYDAGCSNCVNHSRCPRCVVQELPIRR